MMGIIVAARMSQGRPWTGAEAGAVESVAADVGRGLHHARLYEAENHLVDELRLMFSRFLDERRQANGEAPMPVQEKSALFQQFRAWQTGAAQ